jgi:hypothetical protein
MPHDIAARTALADRLIATAEELASSGDYRGAIDLLTDANRRERDGTIEKRLVGLRYEAFVRQQHLPGREVRRAYADPFPALVGIPEVVASELNLDVLGGAIAHHGSLIVRGLVDPDRARELRQVIDALFDAFDAVRFDPAIDELLPDFAPFPESEAHPWTWVERMFPFHACGLVAADAPRALFEIIETHRSDGIIDLAQAYLGEPPAISATKVAFRRTPPDPPGGWHQDGSFLGPTTPSMNVWLAVSDAGRRSQSIEVVPRRFDELVPTGDDPSIFDWSVSDATANLIASGDTVTPVFDPGDAIIFDQLSLHRTAVTAGMTEDRYAIESWFFAPSRYPPDQIPLLV